jgi:hypothetical protein
MKSLWNAPDRLALDARIARLTPEHRALWGRMSAPQMVVHLADAVRMATGELPIPMKKTFARHMPIKQLLIYVVPFPKGVPTAKQLQRTPCEWAADLADLRAMLEHFAMRDRSAPWPAHPFFGPLGPHAWGVLTRRHFDHHLRQFGV